MESTGFYGRANVGLGTQWLLGAGARHSRTEHGADEQGQGGGPNGLFPTAGQAIGAVREGAAAQGGDAPVDVVRPVPGPVTADDQAFHGAG